MAIEVDPDLAATIAATTGGVRIVVRQSDDKEAARRGLAKARNLLYEIPHPEEPDDPLPSSSKVSDEPNGPLLWFDIADAEVYPGLIDKVIEALIRGLEAENASGVVTALQP